MSKFAYTRTPGSKRLPSAKDAPCVITPPAAVAEMPPGRIEPRPKHVPQLPEPLLPAPKGSRRAHVADAFAQLRNWLLQQAAYGPRPDAQALRAEMERIERES